MKKLVIIFVPLLALSSCKVHESMAKADFIGFSSDLEPSFSSNEGLFKNWTTQSEPMDLLSNEDAFLQTVNNVSSDDNTALYYATDRAIDRIRYVRRKEVGYDPQTLYYVFLISDGLDNASVKVSHNHKQALLVSTPEQYQKRIARRLKNCMGISQNNLTVYPMVLKGKDLQQVQRNNKMSDADFEAYLKEQFACFRYSTREVVPEVNIHTTFEDIYAQLQDEFLHSEYTFRVAKDYVGKFVRMTITNDQGEKAVIEGTLKRTGLSSYVLADVQLNGVKADLKDFRYVSFDKRDLKSQNNAYRSENVYFVLPDMRSANTNVLFMPTETTQEYLNGNVWQENTEYTKDAKSNPNTYCIFLMDASKSMGDDIQDAKECVEKIVDMIH